jgi:hypothetical protein
MSTEQVAQIERLAAINAELIAALRLLVDRDLSYFNGYASIERNDVVKAREVLAKATKETA